MIFANVQGVLKPIDYKHIVNQLSRSCFSTSSTLFEGKINLSFQKFTGDDKQAPLIILHGLLGNKNNWKSIAKALTKSTNRTIYTLDARNHGQSPHTPGMNYPLMGEDLVTFLSERNLSSAAVMGHSMGGRAAMAAALMQPAVVSQLLVLDISPLGVSDSISSLPRFVEIMRRIELPSQLTMQQARKIVDTALVAAVPEVGIRQFLLTNLYKSNSGEFKWRANLDAISSTFNPHISTFPWQKCGQSYDGPTTFIGGANSDYIKVHEHHEIRGIFPRAEFHYLEGAGHWLHADKPKQFLELVTPMIS